VRKGARALAREEGGDDFGSDGEGDAGAGAVGGFDGGVDADHLTVQVEAGAAGWTNETAEEAKGRSWTPV
jgi:hypothetical protein